MLKLSHLGVLRGPGLRQPSWSVRTALMAVRAFMPSPPEGAVGSLDYTAGAHSSTSQLNLSRFSHSKHP